MPKQNTSPNSPATTKPVLPTEWLREKVDKVDHAALFAPNQDENWQRFISKKTEGDELWTFKSSPESFNRLAGHGGYAIVRQGEPIATIVTYLN